MIYQAGSTPTVRRSFLTGVMAKRIAAVFLVAFLMTPFISVPSLAEDNPKVKEAMQTLKDETGKLGKPKVEGGNLIFGSTKMNENYTVVDAVKAKHESTATLFIKKDANYVRVSTNVMKEGQRAVGSNLDPNGPAYAAINQGKAFYGLVDILGKTYDTGYEPIKNEGGDVIGIYYVGYLME